MLSTHDLHTGIANRALFYNLQCGSRGATHGDDLYVLSRRRNLDEMMSLLKSEYSVRGTHRLGFSEGCVQEAVILNRVVKLGRDESGRKFVQYEPNARLFLMILKTLGLTSKSIATIVPGVEVTDAD